MPMSLIKKRLEKPVAWVWIFFILLTILLWSWIIREDHYELTEETRHTYQNVSMLTRGLDEHLRLGLSQVDDVLLFLKSRYEVRRKWSDGSEAMMQVVANKAMFLLMLDQRGEVEVSSTGATHGNFADRDYFQFHQYSSKDELYIGKPIIGRGLVKPIFTLSRKINNPDGSFGGVIVVAVDPDYFSDYYQSMNLPDTAVISVIGTTDRLIRLRRIGLNTTFGQAVPADAPLFYYAAQADEGTFNTQTIVDNQRRFVGYKKMADYPLLVVVGMEETAALASYYTHRNSKIMLAMALNALVLFYSFLLSRSLRKRDEEFENRIALQSEQVQHIALASVIQKTLLPQPKQDEQIEIDVIFEPCKHLSGDFLGVKRSDDKLRGFVLDVMGHGIATALQTAALNALLNEQIDDANHFDCKILRTVNDKMIHYVGAESFAAMILFEFDFVTGELTIVSGGINRVIANIAKKNRLINIPGIVVGATDSPEFDTIVIPFRAGDHFIFASDGITDRVNVTEIPPGFKEGMDWLKKVSLSPERWDDCAAIGIRILNEKEQHENTD